jgi:hypothetical protein
MSWQIPLTLTGFACIDQHLVDSIKRKKLSNYSQAYVVCNPAPFCQYRGSPCHFHALLFCNINVLRKEYDFYGKKATLK